MKVLISCAKTMRSKPLRQDFIDITKPLFASQAEALFQQMVSYSTSELQELLGVNSKIAAQNVLRYHNIVNREAPLIPSVLAYTGIVFKQLEANSWRREMWEYAQQHLLFTSFGYGLLRPQDGIYPYRLEGNVDLPLTDHQSLFQWWRSFLTDTLIDSVQKAGGVLVFLASNEMRGLFDWNKVLESIKVITPEFYINKGGALKQIVVYTKMARGQMTKYILQNQLQPKDMESLYAFEWEGYRFEEEQQRQGETVLTFVGRV